MLKNGPLYFWISGAIFRKDIFLKMNISLSIKLLEKTCLLGLYRDAEHIFGHLENLYFTMTKSNI